MNNSLSKRTKGFSVGIFLVVSFFYSVIIILYFYFFFHNFTSSLIGPPEDNIMDFWNNWYSQVTLDSNPKGFFGTNLILYPEGTNLYYHPFTYSNIIILFLIRKIISLPMSINILVGLHNGLLLLSFYLAAIGAFYLSRRFTQYALSAFVGGFIFAFSPFHSAHLLHHMHVSTIQYIPFFLICFFRYTDNGKPVYLAGSIIFYFLSALSCWYYIVYIGFFMTFYYLFKVVEQRKMFIRELFWPILANVAGVIILLLPLIIQMVSLGMKRNMYKSSHDVYVADLAGYIVFHPYHLLSGISQPIWSHFRGNLWEMTVYLGLINIGLFVWAFVNRKRLQIREMNFLLWGMIFFMVMASGSHLYILGVKTIFLPGALIAAVPFLKHVRTPSRAVVFVYLFLGIGVGLALDAIIKLYSNKKGFLVSFMVVILLLILVDYYPIKLESTIIKCPEAYRIINQDCDKDYAILDLPIGYYEGNQYMMLQAACHGRPIVTGTAPRVRKQNLIDLLEKEDMTKQKTQLIKNKVKYIILHKHSLENELSLEEIAKYTVNYLTIYNDDENIVLRVY